MKIVQYIINIKNTIFSKPHDVSTEDGRAKERSRRIGQTALAAMAARGTNILTGLLTVPVTLPYLGVEQFGIWMALTGFVAFLSFSDLGLSIGLQSKLTVCHGKNDKVTPSFLISSTLFLISVLSFTLVLIAHFIIPNTDISSLVSVDESNIHTLTGTAQSILFTFSIGLFATVFQRIFEAYQDGVYSNLLLAIGRIFSFISVYLCVYYELPLPILVALFMGCPFVFLVIGGSYLLTKRSWLCPSILKVRLSTIKDIFKIGCLAMSAQIGASIMASGPLLVLTSQFGAAAIVPFALVQRLCGVVSMLLNVALGPLWPAYGEAKQKGDWNWILSTLKKSTYLSGYLVTPFFLLMVLYGQNIIDIWTRNKSISVELDLILVCNFWMVLLAGIRVASMFLNGLGKFKGQAIYGLILPVIAITVASIYGDAMSLTGSLLLIVVLGEMTRLTGMIIEVRKIIFGNIKNYAK